MTDTRAFRALSYGVYVVSTWDNGRPTGCTANCVVQVTSQPAVMMVAINKDNYTHDMVRESGRFTLSVLSEEAKFDLFQRFGFQSGRDVDKFAGFEGHTARDGAGVRYVTLGTSAWLSCRVVSATDLGTHTLFLADVEDGDVLSDDPAVTYAYYQTNIKPRPQAAAPSAKKRWVCRICGYVYEGDFLPDDFICPLCKHPASDFEPLE